MESGLVAGIVMMVIGVLFFFNNRDMGKGMSGFYRMIYTKKNLVIMFKVAGVILFVGGFILIVLG